MTLEKFGVQIPRRLHSTVIIQDFPHDVLSTPKLKLLFCHGLRTDFSKLSSPF